MGSAQQKIISFPFVPVKPEFILHPSQSAGRFSSCRLLHNVGLPADSTPLDSGFQNYAFYDKIL